MTVPPPAHAAVPADTATPDLAARKATLRAHLLTARANIGPARAEQAGRAARDHALSDVAPPPGAVVAGFWPMRGELDPRPLLAALAARGHPVALPVTPPKSAPPVLVFRLWDGDPDALVDGPFKTRQPPESAPRVEPAWLLVPLVGFDRRGVRLGYGGGFYDRHLAGPGAGATALGYAYACQEAPLASGGVPVEPHDIPLAAIVTEAGTIHPEAR
ncbi:5-formyltetrahydrofolate cyclo-ligase [Roseospira navarrensis]|uniref:5-formyltetrahydrofolate cyclo-ligase n=1 Tax=Roseospira navarrensis TaxID=140058 RepID=UPI001FE59CE9|nr:5-formyltetrahydrofolate cyclo-ligase [Roseospira navarrensis]